MIETADRPGDDDGVTEVIEIPAYFAASCLSRFSAASMCAWNAGATFVTKSFTSAFLSAGRSVVVTASMTPL